MWYVTFTCDADLTSSDVKISLYFRRAESLQDAWRQVSQRARFKVQLGAICEPSGSHHKIVLSFCAYCQVTQISTSAHAHAHCCDAYIT